MQTTEIKGFPNYSISNSGVILSKKTNKTLKHRAHNRGYFSACIYKDKKAYYFLLHRLVAEHFIPNPLCKPCVGHIDTNKKNNKVGNLEWCTYPENNANALTIKKRDKTYLIKGNAPMKGRLGSLHPMSKMVYQYSKSKVLINTFGSAREAARELLIPNNSIYAVLIGVRKSCHGFLFSYSPLPV